MAIRAATYGHYLIVAVSLGLFARNFAAKADDPSRLQTTFGDALQKKHIRLQTTRLHHTAQHVSNREYCGSGDVMDREADLLQASWGTASQLRLDYGTIYEDLYQPAGYCVCDPRVPMQGWLFLIHKATCKEMFEDVLHKMQTSVLVWPPPKTMPPEMRDHYTLGGRVQVSNQYFVEQHNENPDPQVWTVSSMEDYIHKAHRRENFNYGNETQYLYDMFEYFSVKDQQGIVLGTQIPWVEAILLSEGVDKLMTIEYQEIVSKHPQLLTMTPKKMAEQYLNGTLPEYDFAVAFSSYEHDGLGRYGDPLDPMGDIWDVRRISCFVKPEGLLYLGVPTGPDQVIWNAHRIYGPWRLPLLTAGWELIGGWDGEWITDWNKFWSLAPQEHHQPLLILKNRRSSPCSR